MTDSLAYQRLQKAAAEANAGASLLALRTLKAVHWECVTLEAEWRDRQDPAAVEVRAALARIRAQLSAAVDTSIAPAIDRAIWRDHSICGTHPCSECR